MLRICMNGMISLPIPPKFGGGTEQMIYDLAKYLSQKDLEIHIVVSQKNKKIIQDKQIFSYHGIPYNKDTFHFPKACLQYPITFPSFLLLDAKYNFDLFHIFHGWSPLCMKLTAKMRSKPYVFSEFNHYPWLQLGDAAKLHIKIASMISKSAAAVITPSEIIRQKIIENVKGINPNTVKMIPHAIDTMKFNPTINGNIIRERFKINDKPLILSVGRLDPHKGAKNIIMAFKSVKKVIPDAILMFVGPKLESFHHTFECKHSKFYIYLSKLISKNKLSDSIIFTGVVPRQELPYYFAASDIFVLPSKMEAFGVVFIEAMSSGKPVVTSNLPPMNTLIDDASGILINPDDYDQLSKSIIYLLNEPKLAKKKGMAGRAKVEKIYNWDFVSEQYLEIYKEISNK